MRDFTQELNDLGIAIREEYKDKMDDLEAKGDLCLLVGGFQVWHEELAKIAGIEFDDEEDDW